MFKTIFYKETIFELLPTGQLVVMILWGEERQSSWAGFQDDLQCSLPSMPIQRQFIPPSFLLCSVFKKILQWLVFPHHPKNWVQPTQEKCPLLAFLTNVTWDIVCFFLLSCTSSQSLCGIRRWLSFKDSHLNLFGRLAFEVNNQWCCCHK